MRLTRITALLLGLFLMAGIPAAVAAKLVPYDTYNYDYWEYIVFTPPAYVPAESVTGSSIGTADFKDAQGMCTAPDGTVYIADKGNNRIVIIEPDLRSVRGVITGFDLAGNKCCKELDVRCRCCGGTELRCRGGCEKFNAPHGVALGEDGRIYVADTGNLRVVVLDVSDAVADDDAVLHGVVVSMIIIDPKSDAFEETFVFDPLKVAVDFAGRVFVIKTGAYQGIMTFNQEGDFIGFYGTINVSISTWQRFWLFVSTSEQRERLFIATEFTGLDVDDMGFIYASNKDSSTQAVRRLNPTGGDVIRRADNSKLTGVNRSLSGDLHTWINASSDFSGNSDIVDVTYRGKGIYSILDTQRGRIFTYDHEGNLLYIFGGRGNQAGTFSPAPVAIAAQDGRILALDSQKNEIIVFEQTRYGELINQAVSLRYDGEEALAVDTWREVLKLHETFELANAGIGKAYLTAGDNKMALHYLKLGMDKRHYAIAFRRYRNEVLKDNIHWIFTGGFILIAGFAAWRIVRNRKKEHEGGLT
jgi:sugar lactone lactonase YvrE